jgi:hypothetical protein
VWGGKEFLLTCSGKDWIFVADAHFTGRDREEMETFLRFLNLEKEHMSHLVILGDLFEFFFGFKKVPSEEKPFPLPNISPSLKDFKSSPAMASILNILKGITIFPSFLLLRTISNGGGGSSRRK